MDATVTHSFRQRLLVLHILEMGRREREKWKVKVEEAAARRVQTWWRQTR